jgi:N-acetylglucosamine-6-phosphate deacetylase
MLIINGKVYTEKRVIENGYILTEGTKIVSFGDMNYVPKYDGEIIDAKGNNVIPGFIDQHIHGANGADNMDADRDGLINMVNFLPKEGTTSYLPTTMTQSLEAVEKALDVIVDYMETDNKPGESEILGVHLEGPFISKKHVGAQNPAFVQVPSVEKFDRLNKAARGHIKIITYAPEEAEEGFTNHLVANGVVPSAGHTDADYAFITKAMHEGLSNMTHFHNAMLPHHHRVPGAVTAGFIYPALKAELIVDGVHVHPDSIKATYVIKGADNIIAISDAMRAKGLPDGQYDLGGQMVTKIGKECRIETGSLAGSVAEMDFVARNLKNFTDCSMEELIKMTSTNSAKQIGVYGRKGSLNIGKDADIIIVNDDIEVLTTICRGVLAYKK